MTIVTKYLTEEDMKALQLMSLRRCDLCCFSKDDVYCTKLQETAESCGDASTNYKTECGSLIYWVRE